MGTGSREKKKEDKSGYVDNDTELLLYLDSMKIEKNVSDLVKNEQKHHLLSKLK